MKITCVKAADRFDNTEFSSEVVDGVALSIYTAYTCPQCGVRIGFQKSDFERHTRQHYSNVAPETGRCFDEFAREHLSDVREYLDWVCPRCELPTRVYFQLWAGGRHGDHGISLRTVLEVTPASPVTNPQ